MPGRAFISMWSQPQIAWEREIGQQGARLEHSASDQYIDAGIRLGDRVYVVGTTPEPHKLILIGRLTATREVVSQSVAVAILGPDIYTATGHVLGYGSIVDFDRIVPESIVRKLLRESGTPIKMRSNGIYDLEPRSLLRCGPIMAGSAALLDARVEDGSTPDS